jgi:hypothetical protein
LEVARADIRHFLKSDTPFPEREENELTYRLTPKYRQLFDRVLEYAREVVSEADGSHHQRVQWWSVVALLRALASSPAAAAATLRTRAVTLDTVTNEEADANGRRTVFDLTDDESSRLSMCRRCLCPKRPPRVAQRQSPANAALRLFNLRSRLLI